MRGADNLQALTRPNGDTAAHRDSGHCLASVIARQGLLSSLHNCAPACRIGSGGSQRRLLLLKSQQVIAAMMRNWSATEGEHIGDRVLPAMLAGVAAGGEEGPVHSAGMLIVDRTSWPLTDLRVDWHETDPIWQTRADLVIVAPANGRLNHARSTLPKPPLSACRAISKGRALSRPLVRS
jgi:Family of unknown function (DUF1028)